jgi:hypothetical protein
MDVRSCGVAHFYERPVDVAFVKFVVATDVNHWHGTLLPISIGYGWSVDRQPLWQEVATIAKEQACHPRRPLQRTDQVADDVCIRNSPSRPLNDGGKSVEPEIVQGSTK